MSRAIGASVVYEDGTTRRFSDVGAALRETDRGRVELHYRYDAAAVPATRDETRGLWRYRALLPVEPGPVRYPLPVGDTPLVAPPQLRRALSVANLWLKDETRSPTGSNKDRATALILQHAMNEGIDTVSCASTGNVAVSLAVGAAAAGKRAVVFVPTGVAEFKLRLMLSAGATVLKVREGYGAAFRLSRQAAALFGWCDRNTGVNPFTLDAKKTVAFEIWEQLGRTVPDAVVVPAGDGVTLSAMAKGFRELVACGVARRIPRIVGVQAEGCQPIKRAWETRSTLEPVRPATIADGIAVGTPVCGPVAVRDVRESGGSFVAVADAEMLEAVQVLAIRAGVLAEPAGAAALAGLERALAAGLVRANEHVVVLITGSALKAPQHLVPALDALEIGADLHEVERALSAYVQ